MTRANQLLAGGTVLWRPAGDGVQLALVHRPRYDDWSLPKGKVDPGEHIAETAVRETAEETGWHVVLGQALGHTAYDVAAGRKRVHYWAARALEGDFAPTAEVDGVDWLAPTEALARLTHSHDRTPVQRFAAAGPETGTVLLVRHASAGSRATWDGEDRDRPLDARGRDQAERLAAVLACWSPTRVLSADRTRCVQTLEPLAVAAGLPVEIEPAWSDEATEADTGRTVARLRDLTGPGEAVAVCSQGGAIPATVGALAGTDRLRIRQRDGRPPARKGSVWVLSLRDRRLVGAGYVATADPAPAD